jgi:hypothetical protein
MKINYREFSQQQPVLFCQCLGSISLHGVLSRFSNTDQVGSSNKKDTFCMITEKLKIGTTQVKLKNFFFNLDTLRYCHHVRDIDNLERKPPSSWFGIITVPEKIKKTKFS